MAMQRIKRIFHCQKIRFVSQKYKFKSLIYKE